MLTLSTAKNLLEQTESHIARLDTYQAITPLHALEAKYILLFIHRILSQPLYEIIHRQLERFLARRWLIIQNTDIQYCHDFENPANIMCTEIAKALAGNTRPYLLLLMPSLKAVKPSDYITSSYEEDLDLRECILSDDNSRLINVFDIIDFAVDDGQLRHNSLFDSVAAMLTSSEQGRLLSRHATVNIAFNAIQEKYLFTHYGNTAGAAVQRLIGGLQAGGASRGYAEENAGDQSNLALVEFRDYLLSLDRRTRRMLLSAGKFDRFTESTPELKTIRSCWKLLSKPKGKKYIKNVNYCVEIIAHNLGDILKDHPELFEMVSSTERESRTLESLASNVQASIQTMKTEMQLLKRHSFYDDAANQALYWCFLPTLIKNIDIQLSIEELSNIAPYFIQDFTNAVHPIKLDQGRQLFTYVANHYPPAIWDQLIADSPMLVRAIAPPAPPRTDFFRSRKRERDAEVGDQPTPPGC